jgi:hypothetical protein
MGIDQPDQGEEQMATIEIIIRDKDGQVLNRVTAESYELGQELATLNEIEGAIDQLKNMLLPALEADLLTHQQQMTIAELKKADK